MVSVRFNGAPAQGFGPGLTGLTCTVIVWAEVPVLIKDSEIDGLGPDAVPEVIPVTLGGNCCVTDQVYVVPGTEEAGRKTAVSPEQMNLLVTGKLITGLAVISTLAVAM